MAEDHRPALEQQAEEHHRPEQASGQSPMRGSPTWVVPANVVMRLCRLGCGGRSRNFVVCKPCRWEQRAAGVCRRGASFEFYYLSPEAFRSPAERAIETPLLVQGSALAARLPPGPRMLEQRDARAEGRISREAWMKEYDAKRRADPFRRAKRKEYNAKRKASD